MLAQAPSLLLFSVDQLFDIPQILFVIGGAVALVAIIAPQVRMGYQAAQNAKLKQRMIDAGYSVGDIERVIEAGTSHSRQDPRPQSCG